MKSAENPKVSRGLVGEGLAAVIGMPQRFDLARRLSESSLIRLATAFARPSGWNLISDSIAACKGQVHILAGLHFFQTEPKLLRTWLKKSYQSDKFACRVVTKTKGTRWTFHPKVLIVSGTKGGDFAVVGSGNLSAGGFRDNVECSLFTDDQELVSDLSVWFEEVSKAFAVKLEEPVIRRYEPLYKKYQSRLRKLTQQESADLRKIDKEVEATLRDWKKAVLDAKAFFRGPKFMEQWKEHQDAILRIRASLDYPRFAFNYDGLKKFLNIKQFGNLAPIQIHNSPWCKFGFVSRKC
jgi:HKD family nuclease